MHIKGRSSLRGLSLNMFTHPQRQSPHAYRGQKQFNGSLYICILTRSDDGEVDVGRSEVSGVHVILGRNLERVALHIGCGVSLLVEKQVSRIEKGHHSCILST